MPKHSRPLTLSTDQVSPGDLVDLSTTADSYWVEVTGITRCAEDPEAADHCDYDGGCDLVLTLKPRDPADPTWWHLLYEPVDVRVTVEA